MDSANRSGLHLAALTTLHVGPVSWQINRGESVSLGGTSGCGKSLLLRAIADLAPHGGEVSLDGNSALAMTGHLWRRRVGLLPAESFWWAERVGDHFKGEVNNLLESLGLPLGAMEWTVSRCSTGERQRLALARLLQNQPEVLLLDEPTAALDPQSARQVEELLTRYREEKNAAVIWVSHDPEQCRRVAQHHFCIEGGEVREVSV